MAWGDKKHELNVSTYHMCILLLFNEAEQLSYQDIAQATSIPALDLKRALQSLALVKVRRKEISNVALCPQRPANAQSGIISGIWADILICAL